MHSFIPAITFLIFYTFQSVICDDADVGLYDPQTDDVVVLTKKNFHETILDSDFVWNVEFYNKWCGHCIHFAPTYKQLATDIKEWHPVVRMAAIDCSSAANTEICRHYDIQGFPSMKIFQQHSTKKDQGLLYYNQNLNEVRDVLVDYLTNLTLIHQAPKNCPNLLPLKSVDHIWKEAREEHKHLVLIFEDASSHLGRQVMLDMVSHKNILVRRMTKRSIDKYRIKHFPSLYQFLQDGRIVQLAKGMERREDFVQALIELNTDEEESIPQKLENPKVVQETENYLKSTSYDQKVRGHVDKSVDKEKEPHSSSHRPAVYMQDLESTLTYSFRQEIAIHRDIEGDDLDALKAFVRILARYFPGREEVQGYLIKVNQWLQQVTSGLSGVHWIHNIDSIQTVDTFLPETIEWIGCHGSQPQFRGYPCGMWTLFHTLTVSAYQMGKDSPKFLYKDILHAIKGYMKHFFGCADCSSHFLKMAENLDSEVSSPEESVLWLWRAHNEANKRLHGDQSEDPKNIKVQFPPRILCSECHSGESTPADAVWNEKNVLKFLNKFYGKENIEPILSNQNYNPSSQQAKSRSELDWWERKQRSKDLEKIVKLRQQKRDKVENKWKALVVAEQQNQQPKEKKRELLLAINNRGWLSNTDMGLCAMFYFVCLVIILLLYYHFTVRRKWKVCK